MPHVAILLHLHDRFEDEPYFLREIANVWREEGIAVSEVGGAAECGAWKCGGRGSVRAARDDLSGVWSQGFADPDLAILHVDLTVVPDETLALAQRYQKVLNGRVVDISKRRISRNLARPGDGYRGPVVVKTNRNTGGAPEALLDSCAGPLRRNARWACDHLPWWFRSRISTSKYPIYSSPWRVPAFIWLNPRLVVEKFLPERDGDLFCLRTWVFLGDRETHSLSYSAQPIIKSPNVIRREVLGEVPEDLRRLREELGFDFGKFDYAMVDGRVVLYDANRTPTVGAFSREEFMPRIRHLAEGIRAFL